ncbi:MAG: sigma-70 family RNA polymerase sigma factor [Clostridiales bacterium]|nr:sigma-70 family RNA polymerase sigma factor [Clostridiales bacterium]
MYQLIVNIKNGDSKSLKKLIEKFEPIIKKYAFKSALEYDDIFSELAYKIYELSIEVNLSNFSKINEGALVNFFANSIRNHYINLNKRYTLNTTLYINDLLVEPSDNIDYSISLLVNELLEQLTPYQRTILTQIFFYGYTETELSYHYKKTPRAISNVKRKALEKLKTLNAGGH